MTAIFTLIVAAAIPLIALAYGQWKIVAPALVTLLACPAVVLQTPVWVHYRSMDFARQRTLQAVDPVLGLRRDARAGDRRASATGRSCIGTVAGAWAAALVACANSPYPLRLRYDRGTLREYYTLLLAAVPRRRARASSTCRSTCSPARACSAWPASAT